MTNVKVNPRRVEKVITRFYLHVVFSFLLLYPILARFIAPAIGGNAMAPYFFTKLLPPGLGELFLTFPAFSGVLFGLVAIATITLGALSMEIHSVYRKLISFPLFLLNLLTALIYFASALA